VLLLPAVSMPCCPLLQMTEAKAQKFKNWICDSCA
jgi:hypothetical protein